ncbi:transposase [Lancefieldella rimae]|uniref:transposase n=1 Tax=Lancefieldella rimae TaxID=1383 RepID=UPI0035CF908F
MSVRCNYLKCRVGNHVRSQTVVIAITLCLNGLRKFGVVDCVDTESRTSWREFLLDLRRCGITSVSCTSLTTIEDLYGQSM